MSRRLLLCSILLFLLVSCSGGSDDPTAPPATLPPAETVAPTPDAAACTAIVEQALSAVDESCQGTGRNQVCYGNILLNAEFREGAPAMTFERPGDIADLDDIRTVNLSPMNTVSNEWGVALMKLQANLPDSLPGQNVTFLMFGNVELENVTEEGSNVEAFYFRTGVADAPCEAAPDSGLLVQTPEGVAEISLRMNGVDVALGSTAYFQAQPGDDLTVSVVEGKAEVTSQGETRIVTAGNRTDVPMDADLNPAGPPSPPQPYQGVEVSSLPVNNLERPINIVTVALASDFTADADDWTIFQDGTPVEHFPADETSDGYICSTDQSDGVDWYFQAPDDWLGNQSGAYSGMLAYRLRQSTTEDQYDAPDVLLEGNGITLNYDTDMNPGVEWTAYEVLLREDAGWIRADTRVPPTQDEFQSVLANLTALRIRGEFIDGTDTGCMDYAQLGNTVQVTTPFDRPPTPIPPTNTPGPTATATTAATASPTAPPAQTFNLSVGESVEDGFPAAGAGNLEAPGAIDVYLFTLAEEQNLYFDAQSADGTLTWTLSDANGAAVFEGEPLWTDNDDPGTLTLAPGTYTIAVAGTGGDFGTYQFAVVPAGAAQGFDISIGTAVSPDVPVPGAGRIDTSGEVDVFTFNAEAGQQVYFAAEGETEGAFSWTVTAPDGTSLFENERLWDGNDPGIYTLDAGTYTITIAGQNDDTGDYRFEISAVGTGGEYQLEPNTVVFDGAMDEGAGRIEAPGENDVFTFVVGESQEFYFASQGEESRAIWTLTAPDGTNLFENERLWDGNDPGILSLEPGTYTITVSGERDDVGSYQFAFYAIPEPQNFTLTLDAQVYNSVPEAGAGNIEAPGGQDIYTLSLTESQEVYFASEGEQNRMLWTLTAPDGSNLFENERLWDGNDPAALALEAGTYTITVRGDGDDTGTYQFSLSIIPEPQTFDYAPGMIVSDGVPEGGAGRIESAGALDVFTFTLDEAQDLYFAAQGESGGSIAWTLTDSSGTVYFENQRLWSGNDPGVVALEAGDYTLTVAGQQGNAGTYQFEITRVGETTETQLDFSEQIAVEADGFIDSPGAQQVYNFTAEPGQEIFIQGTSGDMTLQWILTDAQGNTVFDQFRSGSSNLGKFTLETGGDYTLTITGYQDATGDFAFTVWEIPQPQIFDIELGRVILEQTIGTGAGRIESPGATDIYVFNADPGEVIFIDGQSGNTTLQWILTDAQGNTVFDQYRGASSNLGLVTLEAGGEYRLTVAGYEHETSTYRFRIWRVPEPDVFYVNIGQIAGAQTLGEGAGSIETPGVQDVYNFDANPNQTISIEGLEGRITLRWVLTDAVGNILLDQYRSPSSTFDPITLETGGFYTLTISANDEATGTYRFQIWDVPDSDTFEIEIGQLVTDGNIETPGVQDVYTFTADAEQTIYIAGLEGEITLIWNLIDEAGTSVLQDMFRWASSDVGLVTLDAGGTYTITISAATQESGAYRFQLWNVPEPDSIEIEIGQLITEDNPSEGAGSIETPGVQDVYTFTAEPGQTIYIDVEDGEFTMIWNLTDESGEFVLQDVYRWGQSDVGMVTLEAGGLYTLTASANEQETGAYRLQLWDVPEPDTFEIEIGQSVSERATGAGAGNIETPGAMDVYTFQGRAGAAISIEGTGGHMTLVWTLVGPDGESVFDESYRWAQSSIEDVTLPAAGTYTLTVFANEDETGAYQFRLVAGSS